MIEAKPRPPLLGQLPARAWTALSCCAALLFALLLAHQAYHQYRHPYGWVWPLAAVPLCWALRRPLAVLALLLACSMPAVVVPGGPWPLYVLAIDLLVLYVAATAPLRTAIPRLSGRPATALVALLALAVELGECQVLYRSWQPQPNAEVPLASVVVLAWVVGLMLRQRADYALWLTKHVAARAVQAERLRIARELHDMVAHSMGVIAIQSGAAEMVLETNPAGARNALRAIDASSRETLAGLRRMLVTLREADAEPGHGPTGLADLDRLAETTAGAGLRVEVERLGRQRRLPPEIDLSAFRIIQESVTNVVRHADARHCRVRLDYQDEELAIEVTDDGRGAAHREQPEGYGIVGMRERAGLLNGEFSAGPQPEGGFRVAARLPV